MKMLDPAVDVAVRSLVKARQSGIAALASMPPLPDAAAAYAVQEGVAAALGWAPHARTRYWKSGAPSRGALQTHAPLPPPGVWSSGADGHTWPFHFRGIEAEIALRLGRDVDADLSAGLTTHEAAAFVDAMCVSIEIVDSRWAAGLDAPAWAKLADLQSHGALVLGDWLRFEHREWSTQSVTVAIGDRPPLRFRGSHSLGDPLAVVPAWLRHATANGAVLSAGTVVTTGTWCGLPMAAVGDLVTAEFVGVGRAQLQL